MGSNNYDIHDKEVIQYIEENMKEGGKLKKIEKAIKENRLQSEKKTLTLKKSLKKSIKKSLKKISDDETITTLLKHLEGTLRDKNITKSLKKKIKDRLGKNDVRDFKKKSLRNKYSRENQKCEHRNIFNCQKGYNSCRTSLRKGCVFDPKLQNELVNAILDECHETECDCTSKERPYKNYYRGRKYCSDTPEALLKLDLLASLTRFPEYMPFLNNFYFKLIQNSFLGYYEEDTLYENFIMIALVPSIFTLLKASRQIMYEIDNQGFGGVFKKYCRTVGTSLKTFPVFLIINALSSVFCTIITSSILGPPKKGGDIISGIMKKHNNFQSEQTQFRKFIFSALGDKGVLRLTVGVAGAGEEILFRETLPKLLQRIRPYLFKYFEKKFSRLSQENSHDKVEQKVKQTYTILLSCISGLWFGLIHLGNLGIQDLQHTICQVVMTTVVGIFLSYLREKKGLATVWMIHFMNNYLVSSKNT